jgi:hypothetical protein
MKNPTVAKLPIVEKHREKRMHVTYFIIINQPSTYGNKRKVSLVLLVLFCLVKDLGLRKISE